MSALRLDEAARAFVERYHADAKLCGEQADWDCRVLLQASDATEQVALGIRKGRVESLTECDGPANLIVTASLRTLVDILQLRLNPNQPYLFGELTLQGEEADFMRVDYVASRLCAA